METQLAQIQAIFAVNTFPWALKQLLPNESIDEKRYSDFITVTAEDLYQSVITQGFPPATVEELALGQPGYLYDGLRIEATETGWEVYGIERDQRSDVQSYPSLEAARREVIRRCLVSAKIMLNHRYRLAHPELNLPDPSQM